MMRYASIPWPLAGLIVAVALIAQEALLTALGTNPSLAQTVYRMAVWTIGATSLALLLLPRRRRYRPGGPGGGNIAADRWATRVGLLRGR